MSTLKEKLHHIGHELVYIIEDTNCGQLIGAFTDKNKAKKALITLRVGNQSEQEKWTILVNNLFTNGNLSNVEMMSELNEWEFSIKMVFLNIINAHNNEADLGSQINCIEKVLQKYY